MEKGKEHRCEFDGLDIVTDFSDRITEEQKGRYCYCPITHRATLGEIVDLLKSFAEQVSINISKPGITKGQHWHHTKFEQFIVVKGQGLIQQRCMADPQAPVLEWEVSGDKIEAVHMLPGYTHNIINLGETEDLVTVMYCNEIFDPSRPDTFFEKV